MGSDTIMKHRIARWMEDHRGLIVVLVVLPLSNIFSAVMQLRHWIFHRFISAPENHDERVIAIQKQVMRWNKWPKVKRKLMCTARPNWQSLSTTFFAKELCHRITIPLYDILELKPSHMTIRVEPMVSVGQATAFLVPRGYTLAVCLEVAEATLGGLAMGVGMTTYSHKVGLYQETIVAYEMVLADGMLVRVTRDNEYSDLYYTLPWSHGTLGFLVALELQIIKIKINHVTRWYKPWFYKHVEKFLKKGRGYEYIPLEDYLLRHNRSIFWVVETMIPFGNNLLFRYLLGWLLPPKIAFLKFTTTPGVRAMTFTKQVFQDIVLPMTHLEDQIDKCAELLDVYPILVYPCRLYDHGPHRGQLRPPRKDQKVPGTNYGMFNDLGVYGVPKLVREKKRFDAVHVMRELERFTADMGGYPFLYADTFMTRKEFEEMFDLTAYEQVRHKYNAERAFPHLYDKIKPEIDVVKVGKQYMDPL
ncbi:delta(24)-sterol reductase isoform X2 [Cherax quadricarinatus]|uniref:delta(24)-sterol reductase isoform X2 n=2 Tax=Cherax quadricarinatus TaxID=27406 RepID=UPI00387E81E2